MKTFFSGLISESATASAENVSKDINALVKEYLISSCLPQEENPLAFWKANQTKFAPLAKMTNKFLYIPASSVPTETLFSIAGKVFCLD